MNFCTSVIAHLLLFVIGNEVYTAECTVQFVKQPVSQNVTLGIEAAFNCTAYSPYFYWLVNGKYVDHSSNGNRGLVQVDSIIDGDTNLKQHLLLVPAKESNDGITIQCDIYDIENGLDSNQVSLQIQGLLEPVTELHAVWADSSSILVSFTPPYTLDGVPIRNYTIELVTTALNTSHNFTTTKTPYTINEVSWCFNHFVTISAWNDVGEGNKTIPLKISQIEIPDDTFNTTAIVTKDSLNEEKYQVILTTIVNVTFPRVPDTIAVVLHSTGETINQLTTAITIKTNCTVKILNCDNNKFNLTNSSDLINIAVNITEYIQPRLQYNVTVSLSNCIGTTNSSHYYIIDISSGDINHEKLSSISSMTQEFPFTESTDHTKAPAPSYVTNIMQHQSVPAFSTIDSTKSFMINLTTTSPIDSTIVSSSKSWILGIVISVLLFSGITIVLVVLMLIIAKLYKKQRKMIKFIDNKKNIFDCQEKIALNSFAVNDSQQQPTNVVRDNQDSSSLEENHHYESITSVQEEIFKIQQSPIIIETAECQAYGTAKQSVYMCGAVSKKQ